MSDTNWISVATHRAGATGATFAHCGVTAPVYKLTELPQEGDRAQMLYSLAELPGGELAHPVMCSKRRALEIGGRIIGWVAP